MSPPERFRALLAAPGFVTMPAVWDGLGAKLAAAAGFATAFLSGSCVAASRLGGPDLDLLSFAEMFDSFTMVRNAAPGLLVLADGDHGYGNAMNVQRTVRAYGRAGAAAVLIEDKATPRALSAAGKACLPRAEARMKVRAAVEAAGLMAEAVYVERGTMADEVVMPLREKTDAAAPYFSIVLLPGHGRRC